MTKQVIVYSHGFGVREDDRGLFTDIAHSLPDAGHVMFDYNKSDETQNSLRVTSLTDQTRRLDQVLIETRANHPDANINLVCHSQGCVVAAMLHPQGIRSTILTAPPASLSAKRMLKTFGGRAGAVVDVNGLTSLPRRDGSTTIVPSEYWQSISEVDPSALYKQFAELTSLTIINADQDEVLGKTDFSRLVPLIRVITLAANHDFTNTRSELISTIKKLIDHSC